MALHRYFEPISGKLPDPNGDLYKEMLSAAIREANKREVSCVISTIDNRLKEIGNAIRNIRTFLLEVCVLRHKYRYACCACI